MRRPSGPLWTLLLVALILTACTAVKQPPAPVPVKPPENPPPVVTGVPVGFHPDDRRTGNPAVDAAIEAVQHQDAAALKHLTRMQRVPCTKSPLPMSDEPRCDKGMPAGTPVTVFGTAACEPNLLWRQEDVDSLVDRTMAERRYLYAVLETDLRIAGGESARWQVVIASSLTDPWAKSLLVSEQGGVLAIWTGCGTVENWSRPEDRFLLAPERP